MRKKANIWNKQKKEWKIMKIIKFRIGIGIFMGFFVLCACLFKVISKFL